MAVIKSGATTDQLTIDPTSKAARVTLYDSSGRDVATEKSTYSASGTFTPPATPTDLITIYGSASKTVRVRSFIIVTTNTAAGSQQFLLVKRSAVNTGGTFVAATAVAFDSTNAGATATIGHYTANAASLGTAVGTMHTMRVASPLAVPGSFGGVRENAGIDMMMARPDQLMQEIVLSGTGQGLCINFNGAALVAGQTHAYTVVWTEE